MNSSTFIYLFQGNKLYVPISTSLSVIHDSLAGI